MKEPVCLQESSSTFIVKWTKSRSNCIKVSIDGGSKGNPGSSGGGGVIRNDDDDVVCAFSEFYGDCSKNMAEAKAMLQGIIICKDRINEHIIVEICRQRNCTVSHIFREGNSVVDILANLGEKMKNKRVFNDVTSLPNDIRAAVMIDKEWISSFRFNPKKKQFVVDDVPID
ncbi:uncharacterized protein [Nicotiana tomentosiformis]|uniref:uncharacterized protein n=1 Tax=Nicotiana tomentosiformis TaxID=4098 RepID=UPI00051C16AB|nr:uncharacterized protein LOC104096162 [Nicotiana tomentosiformis]